MSLNHASAAERLCPEHLRFRPPCSARPTYQENGTSPLPKGASLRRSAAGGT